MEEERLAGQLGVLIRRLRMERGISQAGLAQAAGLERAYTGMVERGEVNISVRTALKIARGLDLTLSDFFAALEDEMDEDYE